MAHVARSPYLQQQDVRLREDSRGNIEGVEYLTDLAGYDCQDVEDYQRCTSSSAPFSAHTSVSERRTIDSRRSSAVSSTRPHRRLRRSSRSTTLGNTSSRIRLCPSPGKRSPAHFRLPSPETPTVDNNTPTGEIPDLSLPEGYVLPPSRSIAKSPLLNRDLVSFIDHADAHELAEMEPVMSALHIKADPDAESAWEALRGTNGRWPWTSDLEPQASDRKTQLHKETEAEPGAVLSGPGEMDGEAHDAINDLDDGN